MAPNFAASMRSSATVEYWDENGARHTNTGDADITAANIDTGTNIFGVDGTAVAPDCSAIAVGGTWILVPGDPDYGTNDFCVMKYEAKCSASDGQTCDIASHAPLSQAANTPWVNIDQQDAVTECASLGKGYHLITNDEWMTLATNMAAVGSNWQGGVVGTNMMAKGHSDNDPGNACEASSNDVNAYVEGTCVPISSGDDFTRRRTHTLSNGNVVWDLGGNVMEWTSYFNNEEKPTPIGDSWYEFTVVAGTLTMPLNYLIPTNAVKSFWDDTWNSSQSVGQYQAGTDSSGGALRRGGRWHDANESGIFTAYLRSSAAYINTDIGFRCTVSVP